MAAILIVEDDKTTNDLICDYLQDAGHSVYQAYDGRGALALLAQEAIELVILDNMLSYINGIQVLNQIRKTSMIPVLMLTALNDERTQINSFDSMADDKDAALISKDLALKNAWKIGDKIQLSPYENPSGQHHSPAEYLAGSHRHHEHSRFGAHTVSLSYSPCA